MLPRLILPTTSYGVLGIDAAWTVRQPSGVSLLHCLPGQKPRLVKAGRSYQEFMQPRIIWEQTVQGSPPLLDRLLPYCQAMGYPVQVIALDIPLAKGPITGYREADRAFTRQYSSRGTPVHSPTVDRPGEVATLLYRQMEQQGFQLATQHRLPSPSCIEVYPHAAILELFGYAYRYPYKVHKKAKYWKEATPEEQYRHLIDNLNTLKSHVDALLDERVLPVLDPAKYYSLRYLKGYEDVLDSLISATVGVCYQEGSAMSYGNAEAGIWVPQMH